MAIYSVEQKIGRKCPDFELPSVDGKRFSLVSFESSKALLVAFICRHCPYVRAIEDRLIALSKSFAVSDLQVVGICSNDAVSYSEDAPEKLLERWREKSYGFPYLVDETQAVAKAFDAVCTPDLFLFDAGRRLYYHGRLDDNWKQPEAVTKHDLKNAIDSLLRGKQPPKEQLPSMGCSIKWR